MAVQIISTMFDTSAFAGPTYNSLGLSRARISSPDASRASWTCRSPATSVIGGGGQLQLRVDMFNAFNTVVLGAAE